MPHHGRDRTSSSWGTLIAAALAVAASGCSHGPALADGSTAPPTPSEAAAVTDRPHIHHTIDYVEFTVTDMEAAKRFYTEAFDWSFTDYGPEYAGIRAHDGAGEVGGFFLGEAASTGGPLVILYSEDLEATVDRVRAAGGTVVTEPFDFPGGRRFHFADPSGNQLAVWARPDPRP